MPAITTNSKEFITVLSVENKDSQGASVDQTMDVEGNFVTVVEVGSQDATSSMSEVVKIYRLPGERLGMGLKFVGGMSVNECIDKLFIQSISPDSPADRCKGSFGNLREGDQIKEVDGKDVSKMTRLDCVTFLRDAAVCISVLVVRTNNSSEETKSGEASTPIRRPPPPIPPRKTQKTILKDGKLSEKQTQKLKEERMRLKPPPPAPNQLPKEDSFEIHCSKEDADVVVSEPQVVQNSPENNEECQVPPEPSVYTDLFIQENSQFIDSESDDTGSSVSTVISRAPSSCASINGSILADSMSPNCNKSIAQEFSDFSNLCRDNSLTNSGSFNIDLILSPFEELERELAEDDQKLIPKHQDMVFNLSEEEPEKSDSEDLFKCLDEALDAPELSPPLKPPVNFMDQESTRVVCDLDRETGEMVCHKESVIPEGNKREEPTESTASQVPKIKAPPVPPRRRSTPLRSKIPVRAPSNVSKSDNNDEDKQESLSLKKIENNAHNTDDQEVTSSIHKESVSRECENETAMKENIQDEDQILLILRNGDNDSSETAETSRNIQEQMIPVEDAVTESCIEEDDIETKDIYLQSSGRELVENFESCGQELNCTAETDVGGASFDQCPPRVIDDPYSLQTSLRASVEDEPEIIVNGKSSDQELNVDKSIRNFESLNSQHTPVPVNKIGNVVKKEIKMSNVTSRKIKCAYITEFVTRDEEMGYGKISDSKSMLPPPLPDKPPPPPQAAPRTLAPSIIGCVTKHMQESTRPFENNKARSWKWKSEENLISSSPKVIDHSPVSVKDRIKMFSGESKGTKVPLPRQLSKPIVKVGPNRCMQASAAVLKEELQKEVDKQPSYLCDTSLNDRSKSVENLSFNNANYEPYGEDVFYKTDVQKESLDKSQMRRRESFNGYSSQYPQSQLTEYRYHPRTFTRGMSLTPNTPDGLRGNNNSIISNMMESRRNNASKLRGLIIPERESFVTSADIPLPTMRCDPTLSQGVREQEVSKSNLAPTLTELPWKSSHSSNIPKYSPAFKRRSLQILALSPSAKAMNSLASNKPTPIFSKSPISTTTYNRFSRQTNQNNSDKVNEKCSKSSASEVTALNRLNGLLNRKNSQSSVSEGVKEAVNGFVNGALKKSAIERVEPKIFSTKLTLENGNDSCFEEEENLTSKSSSPAPSIPSDDGRSDLSCFGSSTHYQRKKNNFACRKDSSDSALKSMSSDRKSSCSATDDSWSDTSSDSIERTIDPDLKPKILSKQTTVLNERRSETDSVKSFKALAQTWQDREKSNPNRTPKSKQGLYNTDICRYNVIKNFSDSFSDYQSEIISDSEMVPQNNNLRQKLEDFGKLGSNFNNSNEERHIDMIIEHSSAIINQSPLPTTPVHKRFSSIGSSSISEGDYEYGCTSPTPNSDVYGSISSLASSGSYTSSQEVQQLIDEAAHSLEDSGSNNHVIFIVVLHKEAFRTSTGITLSGGSDYEQKEIIVHKVIKSSLADKDGRIRKGDRILSINGRTLKNVTHRESLNMLRSPRSEVTIVACRSKSNGDEQNNFLESIRTSSMAPLVNTNSPTHYIEIVKEGSGLGFSLEGGKDSPSGDKPLCVKRIFTGGAAEKSGNLSVGDEIIGVNETTLTNMSRIEAWQYLKKLPESNIRLSIRPKNQ